MTVTISKPAINIREQLTELKATQGYEEQQFHFDNLVTNGTFDTDTSGWTAGSNAVLSVDTNRLKVANNVTDYGYVQQSLSLVSGKEYVVSFDLDLGTSTRCRIAVESVPFTENVLSGINITANGSYAYTFTAAATNVLVFVNNDTADASYILLDNISVYTSDGTDVAFTMPKGWKPLHVYDDGVLQREGSAEDYEVTFDGFNYYVKPTVTNPGARNTVIGVRA